MLAEKYHFHSDHTIIHNETGEMVDKRYHRKINGTKIADATRELPQILKLGQVL